MKKQLAIAIVAILVLSVLTAIPVMSGSGDEKMNDAQTNAINEAMIITTQKCIRSMFEGESLSVEELSSELRYSILSQVKETQTSPAKNISSCVYGDITGDSVNDMLVHVESAADPFTGVPTWTDIKAVNGINGATLWSKTFKDCLVLALPVSDLNGDNKNDVIIVVLMSLDPISLSSYAEIIAVNGWDGTELWSKYKKGGTLEFVIGVGFPANLTSANRTDVLVSTMKINLLSGTTTSEITAENGSTGTEIWRKSFEDGVFGLPVDLTNDGKDEVVIGIPRELAEVTAIMGEFFTARNVITVNGNNGTEIWSKRYLDAATFDPAGDLTGDGANDLTVQIGCCKLEALRGYDGRRLWSREV